MELVDVLQEMNTFLKDELARRDVHIEQLQHQNVQLVNLLVGAGPELPSVSETESGSVPEEYSDMLGGELSFAATTGHQETG